MYKCTLSFILCWAFSVSIVQAQTSNLSAFAVIEGSIKMHKDGNAISQAQVIVYDDKMQSPLGQAFTNTEGYYKLLVPRKERFLIESKKAKFIKSQIVIKGDSVEQINQDFTLAQKPGYVFDVTIFDKAHTKEPINSLKDCKIEIYNNTTHEQVLTLEEYPKSVFNFPFFEGNHYTILVRKQGYINRRIEAYVDVNGCIMCIEGMGVKQPDVVALMTNDNEIGYFLGSIDLDSIQVGKKFVIPNIYYDFDKSYIRTDAAKTLDKLATFLKDNPSVKVELGSHTDARGSDGYNMLLSDNRAESAVRYLVEKCGVNKDNITWKGYGETELANVCDDGMNCSEAEHQQNRRTELKITGYDAIDPLWKYTLKEIIEDKNLYQKIIKLEKERQLSDKTMR